MVSALEAQFATNALAIFGNNPVLLAIVAIGTFVAAAALTRIPTIILAPVYAAALIIVASNFPAFVPVAILFVGFAIGSFIFRIWRGG